MVLLFFVLPFRASNSAHKNSLDIRIDIEKSRLTGISKIDVNSGEKVALRKGRLKIIGMQLDGKRLEFKDEDGTLLFTPDKDGVVEIGYEGSYKADRSAKWDTGTADSVIDERGVSLTGSWYPEIEGLTYYDLKVTLPKGYEAISEAEEIRKIIKGETAEFSFIFPHPVDGINLVASDRYEIIKDKYRDREIYACFFKEDLNLAKTYIEYTKKYLELYEELIGKYPYKRFTIVENFLPTGYSMPTFTLLGSSVVRLPFIVETSLGHEILHQWFGNLVYIDYEKGNWAEGLTTYLADHLYKEREGEGGDYRKRMLLDYMSYVDPENDIPLKYFTGRVDRPSRALGYGKTAMVFHMLKNIVGKKVFYESLKDVIKNKQFTRTSWDDLRISFERIYGRDLKWFFSQWIEKQGLFEMTLHGAELRQAGKEFELHFHIDQEGPLFQVRLPITIYFKDRISFDTLNIDNSKNSFDLPLSDKPYKIVLDEDYDIARTLHQDELPPVIGRLLGDKHVIIAVPEGGAEVYNRLISEFEGQGAVSKAVDDIKISDIESSSVIILGRDNPLIKRLYGRVDIQDEGFSVIMKGNPWNPAKVLAVFHGRSAGEVEAASRKITHYGNYSSLVFHKGIIKDKKIAESQKGIVMELDHEATAIGVSSVSTLSDVITNVADKKIIYVGEVHDVFAHHAVQLDIITGIHKKNPNIAIGMEMFQRPFQESLDSFISGMLGEQEFLRQSEYFKRWGFDYNLYKPILDFARTEKIPVAALNLQREIINKVSMSGIDSLDDKEKKLIPAELDFSDAEYRTVLEEVFEKHESSEEKEFNNFYQSQILWDETMAQSVDEFLRKTPERQIIVLAGGGHLRFGSGIPKRTFRKNGIAYATILIDEDVEKDIADYVIFPKSVEGRSAPRLMTFIKEQEGRLTISGFPEHSVSEKAGLKAGDRIVSIDNIEVKSIEDIKIYLLYKKKGDKVLVRVLRKVMFIENQVDIEVEL